MTLLNVPYDPKNEIIIGRSYRTYNRVMRVLEPLSPNSSLESLSKKVSDDSVGQCAAKLPALHVCT